MDNLKISPCETITDIEGFIKGHEAIVNGGTEKWRLIYKERLEKVKAMIKNEPHYSS